VAELWNPAGFGKVHPLPARPGSACQPGPDEAVLVHAGRQDRALDPIWSMPATT